MMVVADYIQSPRASPSWFTGGCGGAFNARTAPTMANAIIANICAGVISWPSSAQNTLPRSAPPLNFPVTPRFNHDQ